MSILNLFQIACHCGDDAGQTMSSEVFNRIVLFALKNMDGILRVMLELDHSKEKEDMVTDIRSQTEQSESLNLLVVSYFENALHLLEQMDLPYMILYTLRRLSSSSTILAAFPVQSSAYIKILFEGRLFCNLSLPKGTFQPFCSNLPDDPLLECLSVADDSNIEVDPFHAETVKRAITEHHAAVAGGILLKLSFTTIFEYLQFLQLISVSLRGLGPSAVFFLAAAVSDFYVPWESMILHKIQSASGPLDIRLVQVPKMLSVLRTDWAPAAFCISFKRHLVLGVISQIIKVRRS